MIIVGEGSLRECAKCHTIIGCYQKKGKKWKCEKCKTRVCPDTHEVIETICDICAGELKSST